MTITQTIFNSWFIRPLNNRGGEFRLYCFPYAGGSASTYLPWHGTLGPYIETCSIQLPGRGARLAELPYVEFAPLVDTLVQLVSQHANVPFGFFGHSMGALLAFEVAAEMQNRNLTPPSCLFVSACSAPQYHRPSILRHNLCDNDLIATLEAYNGTPQEVLANRELMKILLPSIRADFRLVDGYEYRSKGAPLNVPVCALAGTNDKHVPLEEVDGWAIHTTNSFTTKRFTGDHFFIESQRFSVLEFVRDEILGLSHNSNAVQTSCARK